MYKSFSFSDPAFLAQDLLIPIYQVEISPTSSETDGCPLPLNDIVYTTDVTGTPESRTIFSTSELFINSGLTTPFIGTGYHKIQVFGSSISTSAVVSATGIVTGDISICS